MITICTVLGRRTFKASALAYTCSQSRMVLIASCLTAQFTHVVHLMSGVIFFANYGLKGFRFPGSLLACRTEIAIQLLCQRC